MATQTITQTALFRRVASAERAEHRIGGATTLTTCVATIIIRSLKPPVGSRDGVHSTPEMQRSFQRHRAGWLASLRGSAERFLGIGTFGTSVDQFVIFGERHLRYLVGSFVDHLLTGRNHQGLAGHLIRPPTPASNDNGSTGAIQCQSRLGGLLSFYHREVA